MNVIELIGIAFLLNFLKSYALSFPQLSCHDRFSGFVGLFPQSLPFFFPFDHRRQYRACSHHVPLEPLNYIRLGCYALSRKLLIRTCSSPNGLSLPPQAFFIQPCSRPPPRPPRALCILPHPPPSPRLPQGFSFIVALLAAAFRKTPRLGPGSTPTSSRDSRQHPPTSCPFSRRHEHQGLQVYRITWYAHTQERDRV